MKFGKFLIILSLVTALTVAFVIPSETLAAENDVIETDLQVKQLSEQEMQQLALRLNALYVNENSGNTGSGNHVIETRGLKSKAALKVAEMLIKPGNKPVNTLEDFGLLDAAAAKSFKKVTGKVGKFVESLASAEDDAADWIFL
ncbi:hypothetical protein JFL43_04255 [Viridibacillus sp. YIM B01967]|uniref:Uncharacterized protein n=1 Tax=Viridibacillus soli TaxID=2798301 RepID=A0ABS1H4L0_9BACL|nr:hypothetical protein [Viridibacillus soli]MBK3494082.1 hypothetical protein [Viridibacillus soli]